MYDGGDIFGETLSEDDGLGIDDSGAFEKTPTQHLHKCQIEVQSCSYSLQAHS